MSKKLILKSSDGENFEVDEAVARESQTIKHLIQDDCTDNGIPLHNVSSNILVKVIEYCKKHVKAATAAAAAAAADAGDKDICGSAEDDDLKAWDADFVDVDQPTLFNLIMAANYLNIKGLLDLTCKTVADMMKGKTTAELRTLFNITNDYTPEEEETILMENQWAFQ